MERARAAALALALLVSLATSSLTHASVWAPLVPGERTQFRCDPIRIYPGWLPDGFTTARFPKPAPQGVETSQRQRVVHYAGVGYRHVEIRRPATLFVELAQSDDAPTVRVLGHETAGIGPLSPGGRDTVVQFTHPAGSRRGCSVYSLHGYGMTRAQVLRVARNLQTSRSHFDTASAFRAKDACAFQGRFRGFPVIPIRKLWLTTALATSMDLLRLPSEALRSVSIVDGVATVDLVGEPLRGTSIGTSCAGASFLQTLNKTAFQFPNVGAVRYTIDNSCREFQSMMQSVCFGGHGIVTREEWEG